MPTLTFLPSGKTVTVPSGTLLSTACREAGFILSAPCGGKGVCGKCRVQILQGDIPVDGAQMGCVSATLLSGGWRAACASRIHGDLVVAEPTDSPATEIVIPRLREQNPVENAGFWQHDLALPPPSRDDRRDDLSRLADALSAAAGRDTPPIRAEDIPIRLVASLPATLREGGFTCRVVGAGRRVIALRNPETAVASRPLGLAVDLGTTTLAAALCDLETGEALAVASRANPQAEHGLDVVSRMEFAAGAAGRLRTLQRLVVNAIEEMAADALAKSGVRGEILLVAVAGNTVMTHILLGVDPAGLGVSPFVPAFLGAMAVPGGELGWKGNPPPLVMTLPGIGSYVGGDIAAGILANGVLGQRGPVLFVDVGTNGEIVLVADGRAYAAAAAAGPAFEGARIEQGMLAASGAVSRVEWRDGSFACDVIGGGPGVGVCGTGLLDAVAALLKSGLVDSGGRLIAPTDAAVSRLPSGAASHLFERDGKPHVWLVRPGDGGEGVFLGQGDVRELQLAKGAIAAAVRVLLKIAAVKPERVERVLIAGGFGSYLRAASVLAVGLLPRGLDVSRIKPVGNAALAGARLCLHSERKRAEAASICERVEYVELSGHEEFQTAFAEEMLFPGGRGL